MEQLEHDRCNCPCGRSFDVDANPRPCSLVFPDRDYQTVIESGNAALTSADSSIAIKSYSFTAIYECPDCGRLIFNAANGGGLRVFAPERHVSDEFATSHRLGSDVSYWTEFCTSEGGAIKIKVVSSKPGLLWTGVCEITPNDEDFEFWRWVMDPNHERWRGIKRPTEIAELKTEFASSQ